MGTGVPFLNDVPELPEGTNPAAATAVTLMDFTVGPHAELVLTFVLRNDHETARCRADVNIATT